MSAGAEPEGGREANFVEALCLAFPAVASARDMQLRLMDEVSPYLLMADVGRHVEALHAASEREGAPVDSEVVRLCSFLSGAHAAGSAEVAELVEAAFMLNIDAPSPSYAGLRELLSPGLRASVESRWPGVDFG